MESDSKEPPSKRCRYERSSTPIRELGNVVLPGLSPLGEEDGGENGLESEEEPVAQAPVVPAELDMEQDLGPDYFGLSNEAMGEQIYCCY